MKRLCVLLKKKHNPPQSYNRYRMYTETVIIEKETLATVKSIVNNYPK
jgi:hypothetical protein